MRSAPTLLALLAVGCGAASPHAAAPPDRPDAGADAPVDPDGDGIAEGDACPCEPEDVDGTDDGDGCIDPDDDHDRIVDVCDTCPADAETWNAYEDDDGCPDRVLLILVDERIMILERIEFDRGSAALSEENAAVLDAIAETLLAYPNIVRVRILGHADARERGAAALSLRRAEAVRDALVARGVQPDRLVAEGHGSDEPLDEARTEEARARNRRVEFDLDTEDPPPPEPHEPAEGFCPDGRPLPEPAGC